MTEERRRELSERYMVAAHAMQSGVATEIMLLGVDGAGADPKHLRTGVNSSMVQSSALGELLIKKGLITEEEYMLAITEGMEKEHKRYEDALGVKLV